MQSPNIFTIGGSVSANAHGDDFRSGSVGNSVVAFNLLLANGKKVTVTPDKEPLLWSAVIGGYGLFGVITDVTLQLTDNDLLMGEYKEMAVDRFSNYFREDILNNKNIVLFYAHLNIVPESNFLQNMYIIAYKDTHKLPDKMITLENPDKWNDILTPLFNLSRHSQLGKKWRWHIEKKIFYHTYANRIVTRNNAMQKPVKFASEYQSKHSVDWLQEYFIPTDKLTQFIKTLRYISLKNHINLLNVTIRYVPSETNTLLTYSKTNCFSVVLYFQQNLAFSDIQQTQTWTQDLIEAALSLNGNYYLTYQNFAREDQFTRAYPGYRKVIQVKQTYDPKNILTNRFYQTNFK